MEITWYGHSCFRIVERSMATVITDPFDHKEVGYSELKLKGDIVTVSHDAPGHNHAKVVKGSAWTLDHAGEYEIGGVFITAVATGGNGDRNMVFVFDYDGLNICHLGDLKAVPGRKEIEQFGAVDVLLVPVGGGNGLNAAKAAEVISLIEPSLVVPMHYATPETALKLNSLNPFLKQMGMSEKVEQHETLKVSRASLPEDTQVVVLKHNQ
ncbi:MAG: MBL fold metallo-hydrolase [Chloroflexi bacterium]|nr:MBL fold metallo-hydrolase [Chloroflexota bacterium]